MDMVTKAQRLLRYHRQNVFHDDAATGARHERAARRIKASKTFRDYMEGNASEARHRASERALSLWA